MMAVNERLYASSNGRFRLHNGVFIVLGCRSKRRDIHFELNVPWIQLQHPEGLGLLNHSVNTFLGNATTLKSVEPPYWFPSLSCNPDCNWIATHGPMLRKSKLRTPNTFRWVWNGMRKDASRSGVKSQGQLPFTAEGLTWQPYAVSLQC